MKVTQPTPVDTTGVRDPGMVSLISLASSLGWNVLFKPNNPVVLTARNGISLRLPTNTSIRISVFQSRLSAIITHTELSEFEPTPELIEKIIDRSKVDRDHARRLRIAIGVDPNEHRRRIEPVPPGEPKEPQPVTQRLEVPPTPIGVGEEPWVVSREPYVRSYNTGAIFKSNTVAVVTYSDGRVAHACTFCGKEFPVGTNVGGHYGKHVQNEGAPRAKPEYLGYDKNAAALGRRKRGARTREAVKAVAERKVKVTAEPVRQLTAQDLDIPLDHPGWMGEGEVDRFIEVITEPTVEAKLAAIREILGVDPELAELRLDNAGLRDENFELRDRLTALEGNLNALRELLAGDL